MKIICIENNYAKTKEGEKDPIFFLKPDSSISKNKEPFFIPEHSKKIIPRINIVLKICKLGKNIQEKFAYTYYNEIGVGIDMEATDTLEYCKINGLPWETAKAFDSSAHISEFISIKKIENISNLSFSLFINGKCMIKSNISKMIFSFDEIISHISKFHVLKMGDYIFTGSPIFNYTVDINDKIECFINDQKLLWFTVK